MTCEVLALKLASLERYLDDLEQHRNVDPDGLAGRLQDAAGLRNVLVHIYDDIDHEIVAASVGRALDDFGAFLELYRARLSEREE